MAQVGMRMHPGGNNQVGMNSSSHPLHHHTNGGVLAPPPTMHHIQSRASAPTHMIQNSTAPPHLVQNSNGPPHMVQNSNGPPHILRRMPLHQINHSHQSVQGVSGHSHTNISSSNHVMMNQFAPPPPPPTSTVMVNNTHTLPPSGTSNVSPNYRLPSVGGVHTAAPLDNSRSNYLRQRGGAGVQQNLAKYRSLASSGGPPPSQYTRPPPPLVGVHLHTAKELVTVTSAPPIVSDVCVSAKQKAKELKEKTPMCLVNELARFNKIEHHYKLTDETGPAHKKSFTVCLKIGDKEEYIASGPSIKKGQHAAAAISLEKTAYKHPTPKVKNTNIKMVTPTVELNGLAMKIGEVPEYSVIRKPGQASISKGVQGPAYLGKLKVGQQQFTAEGITEKAAKHNVASLALKELQIQPSNSPESKVELDPTSSPFVPGATEHDDLKSPISLVHEMALKRNLQVEFSVVQESGQPHMRLFVTKCMVGDHLTKGEGNSKKSSKKTAAELMMNHLRKMPPVASAITQKHKTNTTKKKSKNLIKAEVTESSEAAKQSINPISRLIQIQQAKKEKEPVYTMIDERGLPRRREFFIKVTVGTQSAVGSGPNKKVAKRAAAENFLQQTGYSRSSLAPTKSSLKISGETSEMNKKLTFEDEVVKSGGGSTGRQVVPGVKSEGGSTGRQVVPGILFLDHKANNKQKVTNGESSPSENLTSSQNQAATIAKELLDGGTSPTADELAKAAAAASSCSTLPQTLPSLPSPTTGQGVSSKEQLAYLSQILGFTVTYNHFPKKGEYLTLVSLSTNPPQVCHGTGQTLESSHNNAAHNALKTLADNGLDNIDKEGAVIATDED